MKTAITIDSLSENAFVSKTFGRSKGFLIVNSNGINEIIKNPFTKVLGGAGIESAKFLIEKEISNVITGSIGYNAYMMLNSTNINVYKCKKIKMNEAYSLFTNNEIKEITIKHIK